MQCLIHYSAMVAFMLVPLPLLGGQGGAKDKEDPLIADMKFVKVPKGTFWMSKDGKNAQVQVTIAKDFELAAYTVTQEQWETVMGKNPSYFSRKGEFKDKVKDIADADLKRFPVENVSWNDVQEFLTKNGNVYQWCSDLYDGAKDSDRVMLADNQFTRNLERRILSRMNAIREWATSVPTGKVSNRVMPSATIGTATQATKFTWRRPRQRSATYVPRRLCPPP
jgi:formylglycine-generating enzyme required for sulfatase activity